MFNVEIVILSEHNKRRNCYPVEIVTLPRTQKVEIVNLLKLQRIFSRARCARPLKLYNVEIDSKNEASENTISTFITLR